MLGNHDCASFPFRQLLRRAAAFSSSCFTLSLTRKKHKKACELLKPENVDWLWNHKHGPPDLLVYSSKDKDDIYFVECKRLPSDRLRPPQKRLFIKIQRKLHCPVYILSLKPRALFGPEVIEVSETRFFDRARKKLGTKELAAVGKLFEFSEKFADEITWGRGTTYSSFNPRFRKIAQKSLYTVRSNGALSVNFGWLNDNKASEMYRDRFRRYLKTIKALDIPEEYEEIFPRFPVEKWYPFVDQFILTVRKLIET